MAAQRRLNALSTHLFCPGNGGSPSGVLRQRCTGGEDDVLALHGGTPAVGSVRDDLFKWPIITQEDEEAVLDTLRNENLSGTNVTREFEKDFAQWLGVDHALAYPNGTMAILAAIYAAGVRRGDEIICPSMTFWASCAQALQLGAVVVFADIDINTLCVDPDDIEHRITPKTKAIVAVHYAGHPCAMDKICAIAKKHNVKVIEDVSHAHGGRYKGQMVGTFGDVSAMSVMSGKSLAVGEGGMLATNDRRILEQAILFTHYESKDRLTIDEFKDTAGLPHSGMKGRMVQTCSAMGRVQLKHYDRRMGEIDRAMNRFWDLLEGTPGVAATLPSRVIVSPWHPSAAFASSHSDVPLRFLRYSARGIYMPDELNGLPLNKFLEALNAEGFSSSNGANDPLHLHPLMNDVDVYGDGKPTRVAYAEDDREVRERAGALPNAEAIYDRVFSVPWSDPSRCHLCWFKHDVPNEIEMYANAIKKVVAHASELATAEAEAEVSE